MIGKSINQNNFPVLQKKHLRTAFLDISTSNQQVICK
jgi:hypothetical protein